MDRKLIAICILTVTTVALMLANFVVTPIARATMAVNTHDYQLVTARCQGGGDGLYIVDNRTGLIAIFSYDPNSRSLQLRSLSMVSDIFR